MPAQGDSPATTSRAADLEGISSRQSRNSHAPAAAAHKVRDFLDQDRASIMDEHMTDGLAACLQTKLEHINEARRSLRSTRTRFCRHVKNQILRKTITPKCSNVSLALYVLSGGNADACIAYLRGKCDEDLNITLQKIENRFLRMPLQELEKIGNPDNPWNTTVEKRAQRFLDEYKLAEWVRSQNNVKGVAPSFRHIAHQKRLLHSSSLKEHTKALTRTGRDDTQWVRRWMRRWKGARRKIPVHEAESPDELTKKAAQQFNFF